MLIMLPHQTNNVINKTLYSIPVHECLECVRQMCLGILSRDTTAVIVLHVSSVESIKYYETIVDNRVFINPHQFNTGWGWDGTRIHVSNYKYIKQKMDVDRVVFLASNCLMVNPIPKDTCLFDVGFSEHMLHDNTKNTPPILCKQRHKTWWVQNNADLDNRFVFLEKEIKSTTRYGCILEGSFVNNSIMDIIVQLYEKYYNYEELKFPLEEILIPTVACNLTNKITSSLLTYKHNYTVDEYRNSKDIIFIKPIERNMNNSIRKVYDGVLE